MEDPTEPSPLASMTVSQYATGVAWLKDVQTVQERRNKSTTTPGNEKPKGGGGQKGSRFISTSRNKARDFSINRNKRTVC